MSFFFVLVVVVMVVVVRLSLVVISGESRIEGKDRCDRSWVDVCRARLGRGLVRSRAGTRSFVSTT